MGDFGMHKPIYFQKYRYTSVPMEAAKILPCQSYTVNRLLFYFQEAAVDAAMLDKPKKSNKSRFSVDIGKKHINNCVRCLGFPPLAIFNYNPGTEQYSSSDFVSRVFALANGNYAKLKQTNCNLYSTVSVDKYLL
jgi:hypothetical protein